jgi:hypothetical protein
MATTKQATFAHTTYSSYGTTIVTSFTKPESSGHQQPFDNIIVSPSTHFAISLFPYFCVFLVMFLVKPSVLGPCSEIQRL